MAKINLKHIAKDIENSRLLSGYIPKLYSKIVIKKTERKLKRELQKAKPNFYRIAAGKLLIKNLLTERLKNKLKNKNEYKKKYKKSIENTIKKAKSGNNTSIFRLIEWDINWLFEEWIKNKILVADGVDNRTFLEGISEAIKSRKNKNKTTHQAFYAELRHLKIIGVNFNDSKTINYLRKQLQEIYQDREIAETDKMYKLLYDTDYFNKWLIRHKLKSGH